MKLIQLTKGFFTLVDDSDYDYLSQWKWHASKQGKYYYALRNKDRKSMHRIIMNTPEGKECDHIFHNTLDNRKFIEINGQLKQNLRNCTHKENHSNIESKSKYKGVRYRKDRNCFQSYIRPNGKQIHLGHFKDEIEAAKTYDNAAKQYFGEFANLNFK